MVLRRRFGPLGSEGLCRMDAVEEIPRELEDRAVQTDESAPVTPAVVGKPPLPSSPQPQAKAASGTGAPKLGVRVRSLSECLLVAKSEVSLVVNWNFKNVTYTLRCGVIFQCKNYKNCDFNNFHIIILN